MITALSVARERELGTFDQTLVSPATPVEIALGKLLPPLIVALVQATLYLLIVTLIYRVPFRGNLLVFYAAVLAFAAACAGVGLCVSSLVRTQQQAFLGAFALLLPSRCSRDSRLRWRTCPGGCSWSPTSIRSRTCCA